MTQDTFGFRRFGCGDLVQEEGGRHTGTVTSIGNGHARIRWEETGWRSDLPLDRCILVERRNLPIRPHIRTEAMPPKYRLFQERREAIRDE